MKPYTPVSDSLVPEFKEPVFPNSKYIYFLVKIYPAGLFTPELDLLQIGKYFFFKLTLCSGLDQLLHYSLVIPLWESIR